MIRTDRERAALMDWIAERRKEHLSFGQFDCCTLCADYLIDLHGEKDLIQELRGSYGSHTEAMRVLKKHGGMRKMVEARLGPMQPMSKAEAGAIVIGDFGDGPSLGICAGSNIAAVGRDGLVFSPLSRGSGCWPL